MAIPLARLLVTSAALGLAAASVARLRRPDPAVGIVEPEQAQVGTSVTITGLGFAAAEPVQVRWESAAGPLIASAQASSDGLVSITATIPQATNGAHPITITGMRSRRSATATCRIKSSLVIGSGVLQPGDTVPFFAHGMRPGEAFEVRCAKTTKSTFVVLFDQQADSIGSARGSFEVPDGPAGNYVVSLIGGNGTRARASLQIDRPATKARGAQSRARTGETTTEAGSQPAIPATAVYPNIANAPGAAAD